MATRAKKSAARKSTARKASAKKTAAKKTVARKYVEGRLSLSVVPEPPKPKSNFCEDHGRLLRADRTCPVSTCRFHTEPMP